MKDTLICMCDESGILGAPWAAAGYNVLLIDPQHPEGITYSGNYTRVGAILDSSLAWRALNQWLPRAVLVAGFPVCTDLAVSGAAHFATKRENDPHFQAKAMQLVHECRVVGELSGRPYLFENPRSVISSIYRKPNFMFDPCDYGGYLPEDDAHPQYPEYFPPRDAYGKETWLWTGGGFRMPDPRPVAIAADQGDKHGGRSKTFNQLGGKSDRTKRIRSSTPRGFALALFSEHGCDDLF